MLGVNWRVIAALGLAIVLTYGFIKSYQDSPATPSSNIEIPSEQAQLLGAVMSQMASLDVYYMECSPSYIETELAKRMNDFTLERMNMNFTEFKGMFERDTGESISRSADTLMKDLLPRLGGCEAANTQVWAATLRSAIEKDLDTLTGSNGKIY